MFCFEAAKNKRERESNFVQNNWVWNVFQRVTIIHAWSIVSLERFFRKKVMPEQIMQSAL